MLWINSCSLFLVLREFFLSAVTPGHTWSHLVTPNHAWSHLVAVDANHAVMKLSLRYFSFQNSLSSKKRNSAIQPI